MTYEEDQAALAARKPSELVRYSVRPYHREHRSGWEICDNTRYPLGRFRFPSANRCVNHIKRSIRDVRLEISVYDAKGNFFQLVVQETTWNQAAKNR